MNLNQEIITLLEEIEGKELKVSDIALGLNRSSASLYRPLNALIEQGVIIKRERIIKGKAVAFYSLPKEISTGCGWENHKQVLLSSRSFKEAVLDNDMWDSLTDEFSSLSIKEENRHIAITGTTGSGKSCLAIYLAFSLDPSFSVNDIIFDRENLLKIVVDQLKNKSFVLDDVGVVLDSRAWQEKERRIIFSWLEICRMHKVNTIATTPDFAYIDVNYQRLVHYVFHIELKCQDHIHCIVYKPVRSGLKSSLSPVGVFTFGYPYSVDPIIKEYQAIKEKKLSLSARASVERFEKAKNFVKTYVKNHSAGSVNSLNLMLGSALEKQGLDGNIPKEQKDKLKVYMYEALTEKKQVEKQAKDRQKRQGIENLKQVRLNASYNSKYQSFLTKGYTSRFAEILSSRLVYEKQKAINLKSVPNVLNSLLKKVRREHLERFVLDNLDSQYLALVLIKMRDFLNQFKGFEEDFHTKLFLLAWYDLDKAKIFLQDVNRWKHSGLYTYHGKFSPKKWREAMVIKLGMLEDRERREKANTDLLEFGLASVIDLGASVLKKQVPGALQYVERKQKPFWGDI